MRTVIGYQDGKPIYRDDGPARARVAGYGGSAMPHAVTVVLTNAQRQSAAVRTAAAQRGLERKRLARAKARGAGVTEKVCRGAGEPDAMTVHPGRLSESVYRAATDESLSEKPYAACGECPIGECDGCEACRWSESFA